MWTHSQYSTSPGALGALVLFPVGLVLVAFAIAEPGPYQVVEVIGAALCFVLAAVVLARAAKKYSADARSEEPEEEEESYLK